MGTKSSDIINVIYAAEDCKYVVLDITCNKGILLDSENGR
jgi:hypothetical protein